MYGNLYFKTWLEEDLQSLINAEIPYKKDKLHKKKKFKSPPPEKLDTDDEIANSESGPTLR
ncbi:MAG: hypothetical protein DWQ19_11720 [Crenarchaeota archaeon]|nr:MAG: hypothetical protein DWQ19_11720 [Thermoproteota archaeon]